MLPFMVKLFAPKKPAKLAKATLSVSVNNALANTLAKYAERDGIGFSQQENDAYGQNVTLTGSPAQLLAFASKHTMDRWA